MKNRLTDLNDILFETLERLNDDDLMESSLDKELQRAKAISQVATNIVNNAQVLLDAQKHADEFGRNGSLPGILSLESKANK